MAGGLSGGIVGTVAGMAHRTGAVNDRLATAQNKVANLPTTATPEQMQTASRNLSAAQFGQRANNIHNASDVAHSASTSDNGAPDIGDPAWSPPNSVGTGLYS